VARAVTTWMPSEAETCRHVNLEAVCERCANPDDLIMPTIQVGQKFHLQRALDPPGIKRAKKQKNHSSQLCSAAAIVQRISEHYPGGQFVVENKFDGWRICLHVPDITDLSSARCVPLQLGKLTVPWMDQCTCITVVCIRAA
jgi:hypothetical protein